MNVIAVKPRHAQLRDALQELRKQVPTDQAYLESTCNVLEIRVSLHILYIWEKKLSIWTFLEWESTHLCFRVSILRSFKSLVKQQITRSGSLNRRSATSSDHSDRRPDKSTIALERHYTS